MRVIRHRVIHFSLLAVLFLALGAGANAYAWPPLYGPEYEFSNFKMFQDVVKNTREVFKTGADWSTSSDESQRVMEKLLSGYQAGAATRGYKVSAEYYERGTNRKLVEILVTYPELDTWFSVSMDPGVIEVTAKPETIARLEFLNATLTEDIFEFFEKNGLTPGKGFGLGNGHINVDGGIAFEDNLRFLRDFVVDYTNHGELASGIHLGVLDTYNAPALAKDPARYAAFRKLVAAVDSGEITAAAVFARKLNSQVYHHLEKDTVRELPVVEQAKATVAGKYQALRLHVKGQGNQAKLARVEIRAMRHQNSVEEFMAYAKLFENRIAFLKKQKQPVRLLSRDEILSPITQVTRYRAYVKESGLVWSDYRKILPFFQKCRALFTPFL